MFYDTHAHPYLAEKKSQDSILENFFAHGGVYLNSIATDTKNCLVCIELTERYTGVKATLGIHPTESIQYRDAISESLDFLESLIIKHRNSIVAIGECGLDYHWLPHLAKTYGISHQQVQEIQKTFFLAQIQLAQKYSLPLVIHNRESGEDILQLLQQTGFQDFVLHCFTENLDFALRLIAFAPQCKLGIGGVLTFASAEYLREVVRHIPLQHIVIETDSPYLTPVPYRGKEENEALFVRYVLEKIQELRSEKPEEIEKQIFQNSLDFFRVEKKGV